jgi:hypothetical protein
MKSMYGIEHNAEGMKALAEVEVVITDHKVCVPFFFSLYLVDGVRSG